MKNFKFFALVFLGFIGLDSFAQDTAYIHPNVAEKGWKDMFTKDLSDALFPEGVWKDSSGILTPAIDEAIWSKDQYDDFVLDLDFKNADGTNSGVMVHASNMKEWVSEAVEIQIADDFSKEWSVAPATWQCGAIFGHQAATNKSLRPAGEWNHYTITCRSKKIWVVLNGTVINTCDMSLFTSTTKNPDGSDIPAWLSKPLATLPLHGHIGLQGKHAGAPIYFKNIKIKKLS